MGFSIARNAGHNDSPFSLRGNDSLFPPPAHNKRRFAKPRHIVECRYKAETDNWTDTGDAGKRRVKPSGLWLCASIDRAAGVLELKRPLGAFLE
jgi:hypothetical protein